MTCVNARLDLCFHVFCQLHLSSDPLLNMAYLKAAVILVNFVYSKTDLSNSSFLSYFYNHRLVTMNGVRLSCLKMFFLSTRDDESEIMFADGSGSHI